VPTVEGVIVFATLAIIVFNLVVDLLYAWIDPRIRLV
jgi:peptide/nickel transport system permease protein